MKITAKYEPNSEDKCPLCGFRTKISTAYRKEGKKMIKTSDRYIYCQHADCDWEKHLPGTKECI